MIRDVITGMPGSLVESSQTAGNQLFLLDEVFVFCASGSPLQKYVL